MRNKTILYFSFIILSLLCHAHHGVAQKVVIANGTIHIGNGEVKEGHILVSDGIIEAISEDALPDTSGAVFYDAEGKQIYPGGILPNTTLGLREIDAVTATHDFEELGAINASLRTAVAYNPSSRIIETVRRNGVLVAQPTPRGDLIAGQSSVMKLAARNWKDAAIQLDGGLHIKWPAKYLIRGWWGDPQPMEENKNQSNQIETLRQWFELAENGTQSQNLNANAIAACFSGTRRVYVHAQFAYDILQAIAFFEDFGLDIIIVGGLEAWKVAPTLAKKSVPVVISRVFELPLHEDDPVHAPFRLPALLHKAGVKYCLSYEGDMEAMGSRNLWFSAGQSISFGVPKGEALKSVTLHTAEILGIDAEYGSLEVGKSATLFVSEGDAFDMRGNALELILIDGKPVPLDGRQERLRDEFTGE